MPNAQEKFVAARRILKKGDDVYIGVHKEFFFKSNTAAADFNQRINRNGCICPDSDSERTAPQAVKTSWTNVQSEADRQGGVRNAEGWAQMASVSHNTC